MESFTTLLRDSWKEDPFPLFWVELMVVFIFTKGTRNDCSNHRSFNVSSMVSGDIRLHPSFNQL